MMSSVATAFERRHQMEAHVACGTKNTLLLGTSIFLPNWILQSLLHILPWAVSRQKHCSVSLSAP
jgi:hypothetical protein